MPQADRLASRLILNHAELSDNLAAGLQFGRMTGTPPDIRRTMAEQMRTVCTGVEMQRTAAAVMLVCRRSAEAVRARQDAGMAQVLQLLADPAGLDLRRAARRIRALKAASLLPGESRARISARLTELSDLPGLVFPTMPRKLKKLEALLQAP
jgi:hypothetical protein